MGTLSKLGLYARTLRHLKPVQITNRIKRTLIAAKVDTSPAPGLRPLRAGPANFIQRPASFLGEDTFNFLNRQETLKFPEDWQTNSLPKLWIFNLHYFDGLLNEDTPKGLQTALIERWIIDNPPGEGAGWEPYANSLRITNWIKWALTGNELPPGAAQSLAVQTRYLMATLEYHLQANHLFVTLKGVLFAGCFFHGDEADLWLDTCLTELDRQIAIQFLPDGAHYELSPMYHALLTEDLLDIIAILQLAEITVPEHWKLTIGRALAWLQFMTRPDGRTPLFNDAAYGVGPDLAELLNYASRYGITPPTERVKTGVRLLADSGYFRYNGVNFSIIGDVGQIGVGYQPAHAHCDMLSFDVFSSVGSLITDTGTSTYEIGPTRGEERGTAAHNTVQLGDSEQSEVWSGFRVGRRAKIINRVVGPNSIEAGHNGYRKLGAIHTRNFSFTDTSIKTVDTISNYTDIAISRLHFHPNITPRIDGATVSAGDATLLFENAKSIKLADYEYAPEFNKRLPAKVLVIEFTKLLITHIRF